MSGDGRWNASMRLRFTGEVFECPAEPARACLYFDASLQKRTLQVGE